MHSQLRGILANIERSFLLSQWNNEAILYCHVTFRRILVRMVGFTAPYTFTQLETTGNTALPLIHTLTLRFSVFTCRILATDL
jgi:hypothetical protein